MTIEYPPIIGLPPYALDAMYLRPTQQGDAQMTFDAVTHPDNNAYLRATQSWADGFTLATAQQGVDARLKDMANGAGLQYCLMEDGELAGKVSMFDRDPNGGRTATLGYFLLKNAQGQGYATRMAEEAIKIGQGLWGLEKIILRIREDNVRSQGVAARLGAHKTRKRVRVGQEQLEIWEKAL